MRSVMRASLLTIVLLAGAEVRAGSILIEFSTPYNNTTVPDADGGGPPYMTALFEDIIGEPGSVKLTLSTAGLMSPTEFVSAWYFNLDPTMNVDLLQFAFDTTLSSSQQAVTSTNFEFVQDENNVDLKGKAVGFDFGPEFGTSNSDGDEARFDADELFVGKLWTTELGKTLTANSFKFQNAGDGKGEELFFYGVAKVQGIQSGDGSTQLGGDLVVVPLPAAAWAGMALVGAIGVRRRLARRNCAG